MNFWAASRERIGRDVLALSLRVTLTLKLLCNSCKHLCRKASFPGPCLLICWLGLESPIYYRIHHGQTLSYAQCKFTHDHHNFSCVWANISLWTLWDTWAQGICSVTVSSLRATLRSGVQAPAVSLLQPIPAKEAPPGRRLFSSPHLTDRLHKKAHSISQLLALLSNKELSCLSRQEYHPAMTSRFLLAENFFLIENLKQTQQSKTKNQFSVLFHDSSAGVLAQTTAVLTKQLCHLSQKPSPRSRCQITGFESKHKRFIGKAEKASRSTSKQKQWYSAIAWDNRSRVGIIYTWLTIASPPSPCPGLVLGR